MVRRDMRERIAPANAEHHFHFLFQFVCSGAVALIDHVQLRNFHYPGLQRLDAVARFRNEDQDGRFCGRGNVELRSEEHTSELQSQSNLVCRLLLEKKHKKYVRYTL